MPRAPDLIAGDIAIEMRTPRERRMAKTRRSILDAARTLIDEQGYDHTTIDQIADRADIAPRTFFRYFPSKEALVFAELDELRSGLWELLEARPESEPPLEAVVHTLLEYADTVEANHDRLSWGFRIAEAHPNLTYEVSSLKADNVARLTDFIARRLAVDPATDPRPAGWAVTVMGLFGATMNTLFHPDGTQRRGARETLLRLFSETGAALGAAAPR